MGQYGTMKLTNKGISLQAKLQTGIELHITKVIVGQGKINGIDPIQLKSLIEPVEAPCTILSQKTISAKEAAMDVSVSNGDTAFYLREIGIIAVDPEEGEILYAYANAGEYADYIPDKDSGQLTEQVITIVTKIGNASEIQIDVGEVVQVSRQEFEAALGEKVDKAQYASISQAGVIKLHSGNNTNRSGIVVDANAGTAYINTRSEKGTTRDEAGQICTAPATQEEIAQKKQEYKPITPATFDYAVEHSTPVYTEATDLSNINSGEAIPTLFGKIKKLITDFIDHRNKTSDSSSASALSSTDINYPTVRDIYHGLPNINGSHSYTSNTNIYAPTIAGAEGYELIGNGAAGEPVWKPPSYVVCPSVGSSSSKTVTLANFKLVTGVKVCVKFTYAHNTSNTATLNISNTGAKTIKYRGVIVNNGLSSWGNEEVVEFVYDGTYYVAIGGDKYIPNQVNKLQIGTMNSSYSIPDGALLAGYYNGTTANYAFLSGAYNTLKYLKYGAVVGSDNCGVCTTSMSTGLYSGGIFGSQHSVLNGEAGFIGGGYYLIANKYNTVFGRYNAELAEGSSSGTSGDAFAVGVGTSSSDRSNGFRVDYAGNGYFKKSCNSNGADYAENWEWEDENPEGEDRVGYFVTMHGTKVRKANASDLLKKVMVVSAVPAVIGDSYSDEWCGKYQRDVYGRYLTEHKVYEEIRNEDGEIIQEAYEADELVLNPEYDPEQEYIPRNQRKEYDFMGDHGKLVVRDDGTCKEDYFCRPDDNGIATDSGNDDGFYVMERLDENHVRIYMR